MFSPRTLASSLEYEGEGLDMSLPVVVLKVQYHKNTKQKNYEILDVINMKLKYALKTFIII